MAGIALRFWRFARLGTGILLPILLASGGKIGVLPHVPPHFVIPLWLVAGYLLVNEILAVLVLVNRAQPHLLWVRYSFLTRANEWFFHMSPCARLVKLSSTFTRWEQVSMRHIWFSKTWYRGFALRPGEYFYKYRVFGKDNWVTWSLDPQAPSSTADGFENSIRTVSEYSELPKLRVQNRSTLMQVLIAIAGVMVAFVGRASVATPAQLSLSFLLGSILLGVFYMLLLGGAITADKTVDGQSLVSTSIFHEVLLELVLNWQVILLVLGSSSFFFVSHSPTTGPTPP